MGIFQSSPGAASVAAAETLRCQAELSANRDQYQRIVETMAREHAAALTACQRQNAPIPPQLISQAPLPRIPAPRRNRTRSDIHPIPVAAASCASAAAHWTFPDALHLRAGPVNRDGLPETIEARWGANTVVTLVLGQILGRGGNGTVHAYQTATARKTQKNKKKKKASTKKKKNKTTTTIADDDDDHGPNVSLVLKRGFLKQRSDGTSRHTLQADLDVLRTLRERGADRSCPIVRSVEVRVGDETMLAMEQYPSTLYDLFHHIQQRRMVVGDLARRIVRSLAATLQCLEDVGLYYTDLKLENVLWRCIGSNRIEVTLADLGSICLEPDQSCILTFSAPERIRGSGQAWPRAFGRPDIVWMLGIVYADLLGDVPGIRELSRPQTVYDRYVAVAAEAVRRHGAEHPLLSAMLEPIRERRVVTLGLIVEAIL